MTSILRGVPGWASGSRFPTSLTTGPVPGTAMTALTAGTAYTAAGIGGLNSGWSVGTDGTWAMSSGAVLSALSIPFNLNLPGTSALSPLAGVTIVNCAVTVSGGALFGISCVHTAGTTIANCTVRGADAGPNRVAYAITSINDDDTGLTVENCDISQCRIGVNAGPDTLVTGCYIHDLGFQSADHNECVFINVAANVVIRGSTLLNQLPQTTACLANTGASITGCTITGNLLAGGGYSLYAGEAGATGVVVQGNAFSTRYFPLGGTFGPVTGFQSGGTGNAWSGNYWYDGPSAGTAVTPA